MVSQGHHATDVRGMCIECECYTIAPVASNRSRCLLRTGYQFVMSAKSYSILFKGSSTSSLSNLAPSDRHESLDEIGFFFTLRALPCSVGTGFKKVLINLH